MPILFCQTCGKDVFKSPSEVYKRTFCSRECKSTYFKGKPRKDKQKRVTLICHHCGKEYQVIQSKSQRSKYCSKECKEPGLITLICQYCGKEYYRNRYASKNSHYCSRKCQNASLVGRPSPQLAHRITLYCKFCKLPFQVSFSYADIKKYCSSQCRRKDNEGKTLVCKGCKREFHVTPSQFNRKYCSYDCFSTNSFIIKSSLEGILELSFPECIEYIGNGKFWITFSNGRKKCPDFVVKNKKGKYTKYVIEAHGDYWHAGEDEQELINLYAEVGYKCLVLWESEVKNDLPNVLTKIANFIGQPTWQLKLF